MTRRVQYALLGSMGRSPCPLPVPGRPDAVIPLLFVPAAAVVPFAFPVVDDALVPARLPPAPPPAAPSSFDVDG